MLENTKVSYAKIDDLDLNQIGPKTIYKYRSFKNSNGKNLILNQEIYLSKPSEFLSPYDMKYVVDREYVKNELNRREYYRIHCKLDSLFDPIIDELLKENLITDDLLDVYESNSDKKYDDLFGVFSASETYLNKRLWSDFADNKKGFCVGIDALKAFPINEGIRGAVNYVKKEELPKNKILDIEGTDSFVISFFNFILTLPDDYVEEREYRFAKTINSDIERKRIIPKDSICEIIIGENMSKTDRKELQEMVESNLPNTKIKKLKYYNNRIQEVVIK